MFGCLTIAISVMNGLTDLTQSSPLGGLMGGGKLTPGTPTATKYAAAFALVSGIAGGVLLSKGKGGGYVSPGE